MLDDGPDRYNRDGRPQKERAQAEINLQVCSGAIGLHSVPGITHIGYSQTRNPPPSMYEGIGMSVPSS